MVGLKYAGLQSFQIPVIWEAGWVSSETVDVPRLQMRGIDCISKTAFLCPKPPPWAFKRPSVRVEISPNVLEECQQVRFICHYLRLSA